VPLSPPSFATPSFFGVADSDQFWMGIDTMTGSLSFQRGVFARDNLIAFEQSLGFLGDATPIPLRKRVRSGGWSRLFGPRAKP
jgi:hypothetical protein